MLREGLSSMTIRLIFLGVIVQPIVRYILVLFFIFFSGILQAEVLFEGYYKVTQFDKHIGFVVQRNEVDTKTKQYKTTSFLKLSKNGFDMTESLQSVSDLNLVPIRYTYLGTNGKQTKSIDAEIKNGKLTGLMLDNGKKRKLVQKISKDVFLSSALYYMMLNSKTGLKTNTKFKFSAIAEESAEIVKGTASVDKKMITVGKLQLLKTTNNFAGSEYENLLTDRGEVYSATTPSTDIKTILVKESREAVEDIKVPNGVLEKLFGEVPAGKINPLYTK